MAQARLTLPPGLAVWAIPEMLLNEHGFLAPTWLQSTLQRTQVMQFTRTMLVRVNS